MHMRKALLSAAALTAAALAAPGAFAQTTATAIADLNIRSGPGPEHQVIGAIRNNDQATIIGCLEGSLWCQVSYNGQRGWAYSRYLEAELSGNRVVIAERRDAIGIPVVTYDDAPGAAVATTGAAAGAAAGAAVAGPVGAVVGGALGATADAITPPPRVTTYVTANPVDPVVIDREVVVGATLPPTVALRPVPDYEYQYVYVNRQPVLVEPATRRIVYVYR